MADWDTRYTREEHDQLRQPSGSLVELLPKISKGRALDIACGDGRNAIFLAKQGFQVTAVDYSDVAIGKAKKIAMESGVEIDFICADLGKYNICESSYDLIISFYYLQKSLIDPMKRGLKEKGLIIFETYTINQRDIGRPKNRDFLLAPNELIGLFSDMHISYYREGIFFEKDVGKAIASIACSKK